MIQRLTCQETREVAVFQQVAAFAEYLQYKTKMVLGKKNSLYNTGQSLQYIMLLCFCKLTLIAGGFLTMTLLNYIHPP